MIQPPKTIELLKMKVLNVDLGERSYPIYIGSDLIANSAIISRHIKSKQVLIVTNETIAPLYLEKVLDSLSGYQVQTLILPDGEQYKTVDTVTTIFDVFLENIGIIAHKGSIV
ncbi:MAG: hypothetical protein HN395_00955, partial [Methylococcales bacterium]|nr:hypothetical protein [Methylococcales bacterium]